MGIRLNEKETLKETLARNIKDFKSENLQILQNIKNNIDNNKYFDDINKFKTLSDIDDENIFKKSFKNILNFSINKITSSNQDEKCHISQIADFCADIKSAFHDKKDINDKFSSSEDLDLSAKMEIEPQIIGSDKEAIEEAKNIYEKMLNEENIIKEDTKTENTNNQEQDKLEKERQEHMEEEIKERERQERIEKIKTYGWIALNVATFFTPAGAVFKGVQLLAKGIQIARTAKFLENTALLTKNAEIVEKGLHAINNSKITNNVATRIASDMAILDKVDEAISTSPKI